MLAQDYGQEILIRSRAASLEKRVSWDAVTREGILQALLGNLKEPFNKMWDTLKQGLETAEKALKKLEGIPLLGLFATLLRWLCRAARFLVDLTQKGMNFAMDIVIKLIEKVLDVKQVKLGGEIGGSEGLEVYVYFDITLFGLRIRGGLHVRMKHLLSDLAKHIMGLFTGAQGHKKTATKSGTNNFEIGETYVDTDSDEDDYPHESGKFEPGGFSGECTYKEDEPAKEAQLDEETRKKILELLSQMEASANKIEKFLDKKEDDGDIIRRSLSTCNTSAQSAAVQRSLADSATRSFLCCRLANMKRIVMSASICFTTARMMAAAKRGCMSAKVASALDVCQRRHPESLPATVRRCTE